MPGAERAIEREENWVLLDEQRTKEQSAKFLERKKKMAFVLLLLASAFCATTSSSIAKHAMKKWGK